MPCDKLTNPIPPYQDADLIIGRDKGVTERPVEGFAITFPDSGLDCELFTLEEATGEKLLELKAKSKWPDHVCYRPCWIHFQEGCKDGVSNRKHWTPR